MKVAEYLKRSGRQGTAPVTFDDLASLNEEHEAPPAPAPPAAAPAAPAPAAPNPPAPA